MGFPQSVKITVAYGNLIWDSAEGMYKYTEILTHYCTEDAITEFENFQNNVIAAEQVRDSNIMINAAQEEKSWVESGKATKV